MSLGDAESVQVDRDSRDAGLLRGQTIPLDRFMVFIGKNDSGKTTALRVLEAILDARPRRERPGEWTPTPEKLRELRKAELLEGDAAEPRVRGRAPGGDVQPSWVKPLDMSSALDDRLVAPVGEVVWLDLREPGTVKDQVDPYLERLAAALVDEAEGEDARDLNAPPDAQDRPWPLRLFENIRPDTEYRRWFSLLDPGDGGMQISAHKWVRDALTELGAKTYELLPEFVKHRYKKLTIEPVLDPPFRQWSYRVSLQSKVEDISYEIESLASGVRAWLNLALREAVRELQARPVFLNNKQSFTFDDPDEREGSRILYLADEPERHLHPTAQREVARWLLKLSRRPGCGMAVATHSPAFVDLPRSDRALYKCIRDPKRERATITDWRDDEPVVMYTTAVETGFTPSDVFLTGTVPLDE